MSYFDKSLLKDGNYIAVYLFLDAFLHFYKRVCTSVRPSKLKTQKSVLRASTDHLRRPIGMSRRQVVVASGVSERPVSV